MSVSCNCQGDFKCHYETVLDSLGRQTEWKEQGNIVPSCFSQSSKPSFWISTRSNWHLWIWQREHLLIPHLLKGCGVAGLQMFLTLVRFDLFYYFFFFKETTLLEKVKRSISTTWPIHRAEKSRHVVPPCSWDVRFTLVCTYNSHVSMASLCNPLNAISGLWHMAKGVKKQNKFQTTMRMDNCHKQILSVKVVCGSKKKKSVYVNSPHIHFPLKVILFLIWNTCGVLLFVHSAHWMKFKVSGETAFFFLLEFLVPVNYLTIA